MRAHPHRHHASPCVTQQRHAHAPARAPNTHHERSAMPADPPEPDNAPHHGDSDCGARGWIGPPGPSNTQENGRAPGTGAPQEWAAPPPQDDTPTSPHSPTTPPTFTRTTGAILCVGGTLYTLLLAGLLIIAHVLIMFGAAVGASALVITTPVATLVLGALGVWSFRKVLDQADVPSATRATVLLTLPAVASRHGERHGRK